LTVHSFSGWQESQNKIVIATAITGKSNLIDDLVKEMLVELFIVASLRVRKYKFGNATATQPGEEHS